MAVDSTDGDYLGAYSRFFTEFVARINPEDQLPAKVSTYDVTEGELVGEIINVTLQYLDQTKRLRALGKRTSKKHFGERGE
ncbi:hypothetical protein KM043_015150 [Ampulex compressa]|nr:hypothetical protein KM043_015150 [Ampulex compressa]